VGEDGEELGVGLLKVFVVEDDKKPAAGCQEEDSCQ
jgi:hypothetical protein